MPSFDEGPKSVREQEREQELLDQQMNREQHVRDHWDFGFLSPEEETKKAMENADDHHSRNDTELHPVVEEELMKRRAERHCKICGEKSCTHICEKCWLGK